MIRVVLAVVVSVALLGIALPAIDTARVDHSDARARAEAGRLAATLDSFTRQADPVRNASRSGVRIHEVRLPARSWGDAGVEWFRIAPGDPGTVAWRVADGSARRVRLPVGVATTPHGPGPSGAPAGDPLELGPGTHRVRLRYVAGADGPLVVVDRPRINE